MTKTKVVLPKDVAEAIENLRDFGLTDYGIIVESADTTRKGNEIDELRIIRKFTFESEGDGAQIILQALVNGYEVEQTPEDRLREYYEKVEIESFRANTKKQWHHEAELMGRLVGVRTTLRILGITIEGIND